MKGRLKEASEGEERPVWANVMSPEKMRAHVTCATGSCGLGWCSGSELPGDQNKVGNSTDDKSKGKNKPALQEKQKSENFCPWHRVLVEMEWLPHRVGTVTQKEKSVWTLQQGPRGSPGVAF